jgi:GR25 family glycosyltransferase involved in LPS biosynthesis
MNKLINNSIVYYINLDERKDRNEYILNELLQLFPKQIINRVSAIKHTNGAIGCSQSHINVLSQFITSSKELCFIFEDDFQFLFPIDHIQIMLLNALKNDFNVIMMSYNGLNININYNNIFNNIAIIQNGLTTAGYIVHQKFARFLLNNFSNGLQQLIKTVNNTYAIDMYWRSLQTSHNKFYAMMPCIGTQLNSYSSIELKQVDYVQCNTCIILTDFYINNNNSPFFCLNYNNIDENTIINIKNTYPKIKYLLKITKFDFNKLNWINIYNLYKFFITKFVITKNYFNYYKISNYDIINTNTINYNNNSFFIILN